MDYSRNMYQGNHTELTHESSIYYISNKPQLNTVFNGNDL